MTDSSIILRPPPEGCVCAFTTESGKLVAVVPLLHDSARLCVGPVGSHCYDDVW